MRPRINYLYPVIPEKDAKNLFLASFPNIDTRTLEQLLIIYKNSILDVLSK